MVPHTNLSIRIEKTETVDALMTDDPSNINGTVYYLRGWVATCACGHKSGARATRQSAVEAQREHRNDARAFAAIGIAL